eukprot:gene25120-10763_t
MEPHQDSYLLIPPQRKDFNTTTAAPAFTNFDKRKSVVLGKASDLGMLGDKSFTIEATIIVRKWNLGQQQDNTIVGINDFGPGTFHWTIRNSRLQANFYCSQGMQDAALLELNRWYHVAIIYRVDDKGSATTSLFRDGQLVPIQRRESDAMPPTRDCTIQLGQYASGRPLNGSMTNARHWNTALDAADLRKSQAAFLSSQAAIRPPPPTPKFNERLVLDTFGLEGDRLVLSWEEIALLAQCSLGGVYFGPWGKRMHKFCSLQVQAQAMAVLKLARRSDDNDESVKNQEKQRLVTSQPSVDVKNPFSGLPGDIILKILENLPVS